MRKELSFRKIFGTMIALLLVVLVGLSSLSVSAALVSGRDVDIIYSNPGEDCSTQVTVSWHCKYPTSRLSYTVKSDINYQNAVNVDVTGEFDDTSFVNYDVASFYKCVARLTDLSPDTEYIYRISCKGYISDEYTFKTAGATEFTFAYMSDIHAVPYDNLELGMSANKKLQTVQTLLNQAKKINGEKMAFVITTGDETWRGSQYSNWLEWSKTEYTTAVKDYLWLSCPGNHEYYTQFTSSVWNYYPDKYASNTSAIYSDPDCFYNTYFNAVKAVPQNGPKGITSCYYTLYNNILFICIDSMQSSEYGHLNQIKAWFEEVCQANEGKYQYLIAYQHYPWYDFVTGEDKYAYRWRDIFDKYGVDLALSGHMHGYLRSKSLYNGKVSEDLNKGTVYVVSPQIGDRPKVISGYTNQNLFAYRESTKTWPDYSAISTITVNSEGLSYKLISTDGEVHDSFTIPAKRALAVSDSIKTKVIDSLTLSSYKDQVMCDFRDSLSIYVTNITLEANGNQASVSPAEARVGGITLGGLQLNEKVEVKVTLEFIDGSTYETTLKTLTNPTIGLINNLSALVRDEKMNISFDLSDSSKVSEYKLYLNGILDSTNTNGEFALDLSKVSFDTMYTLEAYKDGKLVFVKDFYYNLYGDVNLDGEITSSDVTRLVNMILDGYSFNAGAVKLLDNNGDGIVDIGDAYKILAYASEKVSDIVSNDYEVIFVGLHGEVLSKQKVKEGGSAVAPTDLEEIDHEFIGWSTAYTNVRSNLIIRALYEEVGD